MPDGAALGQYRVEIARAAGSPPAAPPQRIATTVLVAAFRTPDFRVDTTLGADPTVLGSTVHGTVEAAYLFGSAVADRPVRTWFRREVAHRPPTCSFTSTGR